jgi:hypothetical protein
MAVTLPSHRPAAWPDVANAMTTAPARQAIEKPSGT